MLALTLEKLNQAGAERVDTRIFLDWCSDEKLKDVEYVRDLYLPTAEIFKANAHIKVLSGCWNILRSLQCGYETGKKFIFLVEEDIAIRPESFFQWQWGKHNEADYFVTCGRVHGRMPDNFYSNPGTCYRRESLAHVIPHINDEYFRDPEKYVNKLFPGMIGMDGCLDDGLIRKIQRSLNGKVACAQPRVCSHLGWHYYDRLPEFINQGKTLPERINWLREFLSDIPKRKLENPRYLQDLEPLE